jgi:hypothetical protein
MTGLADGSGVALLRGRLAGLDNSSPVISAPNGSASQQPTSISKEQSLVDRLKQPSRRAPSHPRPAFALCRDGPGRASAIHARAAKDLEQKRDRPGTLTTQGRE